MKHWRTLSKCNRKNNIYIKITYNKLQRMIVKLMVYHLNTICVGKTTLTIKAVDMVFILNEV
jgi:hypothetical protein